MSYTEDGGVIPAGINVREYGEEREHDSNFGLYKGIIKKIIYPDNEEESESKDRVEYVVRVRGQDFPNAIDLRKSGGQFNFSERILSPTKENVEDGSLNDGTYEEKTDGETVWVMFIEGRSDFPIIIGSAQHPLNRKYRKAKSEDGIYSVEEFNGIEFKIDKDSNYTISHVGRKDPQGEIQNKEAVDSSVKYYGNGDYEVVVNNGANPEDLVSMKFIKADKKIVTTANKNTYVLDSTGVTIQDKSDNKIAMDANSILLQSVKDMVLTVAKAMNITADSLTANIVKDTIVNTKGATINATGNVDIKGDGGANLTSTANVEVKGDGGTDVGSSSSSTNVNGSTVNLGGGGMPVARLGDSVVGFGVFGVPVTGNIVSGSGKVTSS